MLIKTTTPVTTHVLHQALLMMIATPAVPLFFDVATPSVRTRNPFLVQIVRALRVLRTFSTRRICPIALRPLMTVCCESLSPSYPKFGYLLEESLYHLLTLSENELDHKISLKKASAAGAAVGPPASPLFEPMDEDRHLADSDTDMTTLESDGGGSTLISP